MSMTRALRLQYLRLNEISRTTNLQSAQAGLGRSRHVIPKTLTCREDPVRFHSYRRLESDMWLVLRHRSFDRLEVGFQDGDVLGRHENFDAAWDAGLTTDQTFAFESEDHLVH